MIRRIAWLAAIPLLLTACSSDDPLAEPDADTGDDTATVTPADPDETGDPADEAPADAEPLVVGSQQYYSNEIIAELYAAALEDAGYTVEREYQIGQREVYMPEIEAGAIDVFPEYGGNLLQYLDPEAQAVDTDTIMSGLEAALPAGIRALSPAEATDQDSYTVTREMADEHGLSSIADLANLDQPITVAANSEFETRPYGPPGLEEVYGVQAQVLAVEDSGGPLTLRALMDGQADAANIYTADPGIAVNDLVVLEDPENLILPQQVTPLVSEKVDESAAAIIDAIQAELTSEELQQLNARSVEEQERSDVIAQDWLRDKGLIG